MLQYVQSCNTIPIKVIVLVFEVVDTNFNSLQIKASEANFEMQISLQL